MKFQALVETSPTEWGINTQVCRINAQSLKGFLVHGKCIKRIAGQTMRLDEHKEKRPESEDKRQACYYILAYLLENPDAGDTLEGIVEWWLLNQRIRFETLTVSQAVTKLVADGLIVEQKGPDARTIYRANESSENIQAILSRMRNLTND